MSGALLHPFASPRMSDGIRIVGGEGALLTDDRGTTYVDGMASLWYQNIGYGRAEMADAIADQARALGATHIFPPFTNAPAEEAAERIAALAPMEGARVFLGSSGSEAVDTAMKLARIAHREAGAPRHLIVSRERGYHGTAYGGTSAQGIAANQDGFGPLVGEVVQVPADNPEAMAMLFDERGDEIAAVITEPVQGAGGVFPPADGYLEGLRRLCDAHGAFLIFDEVITGFGRTGNWFAAQTYGVTPDLITFAKAVTSGYVPFSGVITGPAVNAALESDPGFVLRHGFTYSGHQLGAVAATTAIGIQEREGLVARATAIGDRLGPGLAALADDRLVAEVRGVGAIWGMTMLPGVDATRVRDAAIARGVIVRSVFDHVAMCPPLVIDDEQIDRLLDVLAEVLSAEVHQHG